MGKKALLILDYSYDFVADDGKLTCGEPAQQIEPFVLERIKHYNDTEQDMFFLMDLHYENDQYHPEAKLFPPHNIVNTDGRALFNEVGKLYSQIEHKPYVHFLDKIRYDCFRGTALDTLLRDRKIDTIEILGVCTDICVLHTAMSGYNLGYNLIIPRDGVTSFNPVGHEWALEHFKNVLGANVV